MYLICFSNTFPENSVPHGVPRVPEIMIQSVEPVCHYIRFLSIIFLATLERYPTSPPVREPSACSFGRGRSIEIRLLLAISK